MMTDCKLEGVEREAKCLLLAAFYSSLSLSLAWSLVHVDVLLALLGVRIFGVF